MEPDAVDRKALSDTLPRIVDHVLSTSENDLEMIVRLVAIINKHQPGIGRQYARHIWRRLREQWRVTVAAGSWAETARLAGAGFVALWSVMVLTVWSVSTPLKVWHLNRVTAFLQR